MDKKIRNTTNAVIQMRMLNKLTSIKNRHKDKIAIVSPSDRYFSFDILALSMTPEMYNDLQSMGRISINTETEMLTGRIMFRIHTETIPEERQGLKTQTFKKETRVERKAAEDLLSSCHEVRIPIDYYEPPVF